MCGITIIALLAILAQTYAKDSTQTFDKLSDRLIRRLFNWTIKVFSSYHKDVDKSTLGVIRRCPASFSCASSWASHRVRNIKQVKAASKKRGFGSAKGFAPARKEFAPKKQASQSEQQKIQVALDIHRRLIFGQWKCDEDVRVGMNLLRFGLTSPSASAASLDSTSQEWADYLSTVRLKLGHSESAGWQWPLSSGSEWVAAFIHDIEAIAPVAQRELVAYLANRKKKDSSAAFEKDWDMADYKAIAPQWSMLHLWRDGEWTPDSQRWFNETSNNLRASLELHGKHLNPMMNIACGIARQPAGTGISPHCDGNLLGLTLHLGLSVPEGCWIEVDGQIKHWQEGKALLFDTTYFHRTFNPSDQDRYVLMLQILRPRVSISQVMAVQHYLRNPTPDLRFLAPFTMQGTATQSSATPIMVYPSYMLEYEPQDPRRCKYRVEDGSVPVYEFPADDISCVDVKRDPLQIGHVVEPCLFTLDADGDVAFLGIPIGQMANSAAFQALCAATPKRNDMVKDARLDTLKVYRDLLLRPEVYVRWVPVGSDVDPEAVETGSTTTQGQLVLIDHD